MMEVTDQALLARYLEGGGDEAFRQLFDRHGGLVYGVAMRATGDPGAAEEVAQDVFLLLAKKARALASHPSVAGWLHLTSRNLSRHAIRRRRTRDRHLSDLRQETAARHPAGESFETGHPLGEKLDERLARLSAADREAVLLRYYEDREYREIAQSLGISEEAVRKRVSRALQRLQKSLGPEAASGTALASLAIAPPPGIAESIAATLSTGTAATAAGITTATAAIMTKQTALTLVGAAVLGGGVLLYEIDQQAEKKRLRAKVERLEEANAAFAKIAEEQTATKAAAQSADDAAASSSARLAELEAALAAAREKNAANEKRLAELEGVAAQFEDQVVVSYGKVDEIGTTFGSLFAEATALSELEKTRPRWASRERREAASASRFCR